MVTYKASSWHYKVATKNGRYPISTYGLNICEYRTLVAKRLAGLAVTAMVALAMISVGTYIVAQTLALWAFFVYIIATGQATADLHIQLEAAGVAGTVVIVIGSIAWVLAWAFTSLHYWARSRRYASRGESESFIATSWRAWRDKVCIPVKIDYEN